MLHCRPNVQTIVGVYVSGWSVLGFDVGHYCASQGCKWAFHVIVLPVDMGICRHFWCNVALSKEVGGEFCFLHEMASQGEGNLLSTLLRIETKWFLDVWTAHSAMLQWWQSGGTSLWVIQFFVMHALNAAKHLLFKQWCFNPSAKSFILLTIFWYAAIILPSVWFFITLQKM